MLLFDSQKGVSLRPTYKLNMKRCARFRGHLKWLAIVIAGMLAVVARAQSCTPVPSGIVGWWPAEGNARDFIGANNGILLGGLSFTNGEVGKGFWFNKTNQGVRVPSSPSLGAGDTYTFECWINPTDVSQSHPIFDWNGIEVSVESGGVLMASWQYYVMDPSHGTYVTTATGSTGPGLVVTDQWQHIAVNFIVIPSGQGTSCAMYLYYDGVQVGTVASGGLPTGSSGDLHLGYSPTQGTDFAGIMDEVSLYTRGITGCDFYYSPPPAVSGDQIAAIYNAGPAGKCSAPASIVTEPMKEVVSAGGEASFSVAVADPEDYSYQWQFDGKNLPSVGIISTVVTTGGHFSGSLPTCVAVDGSGNLFYSATPTYEVTEIGTKGVSTIVAGNGQSGYSGDGGPATNASMGNVQGVAVDGSGNLYIADSSYGTVRKVNANGIITTLAGNGTNGYLGDGGAATNAELSAPYGVAVDAGGNVFIADSGNNVIRKVDVHGVITTFAGNGTNGYSGEGGAATNAELAGPTGVAVDSVGDVFICDDGNLRIREVNANGIISTFAGGGTNSGTDGLGDGGPATGASFENPVAVAVDTFGNLLIADSAGARIREVFAGSGIILTVAGDGTDAVRSPCGCVCDGGVATAAELSHPQAVAVDNAGNLFIADGWDQSIRKVSGLPPYPPNFPQYFVENAASADAGKYSVVITTLNTHTSVTSSAVRLTVADSPVTTTRATINIMPMGDSVTARGGGLESSYRYWLYTYLTNAGFSNTMFVGSQTGNGGTSDGPPSNSWPQMSYEGGADTTDAPPVGDGWTTWDGINDAPNAASVLNSGNPGATILLLDLGANDYDPGSGPMEPALSQMRTNLETIIQTFYQTNSATVVLLAVPTPWVISPPDPRTREFMTRLGRAMTTVARNQRKAGVKIVVVGLPAGFNPRTDTKDGTHPNIRGEQMIARKYFNALRPILRKMEKEGL